MSTVLVLVITITILYLIKTYFKNKRFNELLNKLPSPPGLPFIGHAKQFATTTNRSLMISKFINQYDGMVLLRPGPFLTYFTVADSELVEKLCTGKNVIKSPRYRLFERWLGVGLFTAEYDLWKKHRKLVTPAFHSQLLEQFVDTFNSVTKIMIEQMRSKVGKQIDIYQHVNLCALDIIAETAMGVPVNAQKRSDSKYVHYIGEMLRIISTRSFSALTVHDWIFRLTKDYQIEQKAMKVLKGYTNSVIDKKKESLENNRNSLQRSLSKDPEKKVRKAYLDLIFEQPTINGEKLTDEEISNSVEGFMFAGHDTSAIATGCAFYLLSMHPEIQQKAFEECRTVFGDDKDRDATYKELHELRYLEMVIKESLRLYPSAPLISKLLLEDMEHNGYILPKGLSVLIMIHTIHRRAKYFPNPEKFDPERFSPENQSALIPFSFIPFGAGARNCVGQKFAMLQMKLVISKTLRNYELLPAENFELKLLPQVVQKPVNGIHVRIKDRQY